MKAKGNLLTLGRRLDELSKILEDIREIANDAPEYDEKNVAMTNRKTDFAQEIIEDALAIVDEIWQTNGR